MANVGIVLISHSEDIAKGTKNLIRQVIKDVPISLAGGTEDGRIGTSIEKIMQAIEEAQQGDGVLLFYDIGSAKMNAETAIDLLHDSSLQIVDIPLVEGAYVAAVEASMEKTMEELLNSLQLAFPNKGI